MKGAFLETDVSLVGLIFPCTRTLGHRCFASRLNFSLALTLKYRKMHHVYVVMNCSAKNYLSDKYIYCNRTTCSNYIAKIVEIDLLKRHSLLIHRFSEVAVQIRNKYRERDVTSFQHESHNIKRVR